MCYSFSLKHDPHDASETIEQMMIEEQRMREKMQQLEARVFELESELMTSSRKVVGLLAENIKYRRMLRDSEAKE